jgi:hypothetical protein
MVFPAGSEGPVVSWAGIGITSEQSVKNCGKCPTTANLAMAAANVETMRPWFAGGDKDRQGHISIVDIADVAYQLSTATGRHS